MKILMNFKVTLFICLLWMCAQTLKVNNASAQNDPGNTVTYYLEDDYRSVRKFDVHIHINTDQNAFIKLAQQDNFRFLDIVDDRPFGVPMDKQQELAVMHLGNFPNQMVFATTFPVKDWNDADWADKTIERIKTSIGKGAKAVKIWKNIGMDLKDKDGKFVMVNNPKLDPILDYLAKNKIPLIGHNGEPRDCWLPLDKMTFSREYYSAHPDYHMYLHPDYPSYEDQISARDDMLRKHPDLKFVGAHLGSLEWSLDELQKRLDAYPNMRVDLSRIPNLQLHTFRDWQKTHDFFIKYQDRLVYGSDKQINQAANVLEFEKGIHDSWMRDWIFFATDKKIMLKGFGELKGLKLPRKVIDKIYYQNAQNWLAAK